MINDSLMLLILRALGTILSLIEGHIAAVSKED